MLVGSAGSGRVAFSGSLVDSGFYLRYCSFSRIRWDLARSRQDLAGSQRDLVGFGLDLDEISPDFVQSDGFQVNFRRIASNIAEFCMFSLKNLRISLEVSGFMIGLVCSGFGRGKSPIDPKASGFVVATRHQPSECQFGRFLVRAQAGWSVIRVGWTVLPIMHYTTTILQVVYFKFFFKN